MDARRGSLMFLRRYATVLAAASDHSVPLPRRLIQPPSDPTPRFPRPLLTMRLLPPDILPPTSRLPCSGGGVVAGGSSGNLLRREHSPAQGESWYEAEGTTTVRFNPPPEPELDDDGVPTGRTTVQGRSPRALDRGEERARGRQPDGMGTEADLQLVNAYRDGDVVEIDLVRSLGKTPSSKSLPWPWVTDLRQYRSISTRRSLWRYTVNLRQRSVERREYAGADGGRVSQYRTGDGGCMYQTPRGGRLRLNGGSSLQRR